MAPNLLFLGVVWDLQIQAALWMQALAAFHFAKPLKTDTQGWDRKVLEELASFLPAEDLNFS